MKQQSPLLRIWELGEKEHGRLIGAIVLAAVGVIGGMVPYFAAAKTVSYTHLTLPTTIRV